MKAASTRSLQEQVWKAAAELEIAGRGGWLYKLAHCCWQQTAALGSQKSRQVLTKGVLKHSGPLCLGLGQPSCDFRCFISQKRHLTEVVRGLPFFSFLWSSKLWWSCGALAAVKHTTAGSLPPSWCLPFPASQSEWVSGMVSGTKRRSYQWKIY